MSRIRHLQALEILDSRGRPTVLCRCELESGARASASVPSGASTGSSEALELRDGDARRYRGLGCRKAVDHVNAQIANAVRGRDLPDQLALDRVLIDLDGTPNKARLGANAILSVSIAFARAQAAENQLELYEHLAQMAGQPIATMPRLTVNLFSGGKHAGGQVEIQDVLVVPASAMTIDESLKIVYDVYQAAAELTCRKYSVRALKADEGGLAPPFPSITAAFEDVVEAIEIAGYVPGRDVVLALDVASTHFSRDGRYHLEGRELTSQQMIETLVGWSEKFPIVSIEDGLAEDEWNEWPKLCERLQGRVLTLGDDFLCTNPGRIRKAIESNSADALLLKVNQIGTLTEAAQSLGLARDAGWQVTVSARSGETEDNWLADLAVGWSGNQIKIGSITQSERLAKYNRLLAIEDQLRLPVVPWPNR